MTDIVQRLLSLQDAPGSMAAIEFVRAGRKVAGEAAAEIEWLRGERDRLAAELATAQKAILPWIEQVGHLNAAWDRHTDALRRIGMPGVEIGYCRDGHEIAVLIARDALKDDVR